MFELVHRPQGELNVALGVDMVQGLPSHFAQVVDVNVVIHHYNAFGKHGARQSPNRVHHLAGVPGETFANGDNHQVVKDAFGGYVDVHHFRHLLTHKGQEYTLDGVPDPIIFHGRRAHDGGNINRIAAARDAFDVEGGKLVFQRVIAGVIAKRPFDSNVIQIDITFEDELGVGRDFQIDRLALHQFDRLMPQETGKQEFVQIFREG